ncbi:MAG: UDP-N-acetylmuramoyl-L-alanine--D-glutamate ligase [Thermoleophilia bacterium]
MRLSDLEGRRVGIWGLGREGRAIASVLARRAPGATPVLVDEAGAPDLPGAGTDPAALLGCEVVVRSPGISRYREDALRLTAAGVTVTTGTNLWFGEHPGARAIGVTGSKGKSTTSALIAHLATAAGRRVRLAGNIGVPLADLIDTPDGDVDLWVLELSSYQTSDLDASPPVGVLLNLYREHTDWHGTPARYHDDKLNLFAHRADMASVLNAADPEVRRRGAGLPHPRWFADPAGFDVAPEGITRAGAPFAARGRVGVPGDHNLLNACAALTALEAAGVAVDGLGDALAGFRPLAHRLEPVAERGGVLWVDDSIATIPEATVAAVRALAPRPVVVLVGGHDRTQDYAPLAEHVAAEPRIAAVIGLPGNGPRILDRLGAEGVTIPLAMADGMADAVARAAALVPAGGAVLLSPGAPTGDDYRDFTVRGEAFAAAVAALPGG